MQPVNVTHVQLALVEMVRHVTNARRITMCLAINVLLVRMELGKLAMIQLERILFVFVQRIK